jgi:hypothetical protein
VEKFTRSQARPARAFLLPKIWPPKGGFFMPFFNPYSLAAKALVTVLVAAGLLGSGWYYGRYYRGLECEVEAAKAQHAADQALTEATREKSEVESKLTGIKYQIEVDDAKHQAEIDEALNVNRRLANSLRLRKPAHCPSHTNTLPEGPGAPASGHEADSAEFSIACARVLTELAADADRVREQAIAGRAWAIKLHREFSK